MKTLEWQYSRNQRRHWVANGEFYGPDYHELFEIRDNAPDFAIHKPEHGYTLLLKGKNVGVDTRVKFLKETAQVLADKMRKN